MFQKKERNDIDKEISKQLKEIDKMPNKDAAWEYANRSTNAQQQAHQSTAEILSSRAKTGKSYVLSGRSGWSSKSVSTLKSSTETNSGKAFVSSFLASPKSGVGKTWKVNNGNVIDVTSSRGPAYDATRLIVPDDWSKLWR